MCRSSIYWGSRSVIGLFYSHRVLSEVIYFTIRAEYRIPHVKICTCTTGMKRLGLFLLAILCGVRAKLYYGEAKTETLKSKSSVTGQPVIKTVRAYNYLLDGLKSQAPSPVDLAIDFGLSKSESNLFAILFGWVNHFAALGCSENIDSSHWRQATTKLQEGLPGGADLLHTMLISQDILDEFNYLKNPKPTLPKLIIMFQKLKVLCEVVFWAQESQIDIYNPMIGESLAALIDNFQPRMTKFTEGELAYLKFVAQIHIYLRLSKSDRLRTISISRDFPLGITTLPNLK